MPPSSSAAVTTGGVAHADPGTRLQAEATTRVPLALAGLGAAVVLQASWATIRSPYDAGLALVIVLGVVHGLLGWVPRLRIPARLGPASVVAYGLVLLLYLLLTAERLGADDASVLWTRLGCGFLLATVVHVALVPPVAGTGVDQPRARRARPGWREVAVLALLPGCIGALVLVVHGVPGEVASRVPSAGHPGHHWSKP